MRGIDRVLAEPSPLALVASGGDDPGRFTEDFCRWSDVPEIAELAQHSRVPAIAGALMATPSSPALSRSRAGEGGRNQAAHAVAPGPAVLQRRRPRCQRVDPGRPGSGGRLPRDARRHAPRPVADAAHIPCRRGEVVSRRAHSPNCRTSRPTGPRSTSSSYEMEPGDAIFFDFLSVHGAPGFPFAGRRRVLSLRYLSDTARHAPRRWRTSPPFEGLDRELGAGRPMDHPLFPVVWTGSD